MAPRARTKSFSLPGADRAIPIAVIVPCDHPFGTEAPADPPWPGLLFKVVANCRGFEGQFETSLVLEMRP
jgi:hypothetical protein